MGFASCFQEVAERRFLVTSRGYDRDEVRAFLSELTETMTELQREQETLQRELARARAGAAAQGAAPRQDPGAEEIAAKTAAVLSAAHEAAAEIESSARHGCRPTAGCGPRASGRRRRWPKPSASATGPRRRPTASRRASPTSSAASDDEPAPARESAASGDEQAAADVDRSSPVPGLVEPLFNGALAPAPPIPDEEADRAVDEEVSARARERETLTPPLSLLSIIGVFLVGTIAAAALLGLARPSVDLEVSGPEDGAVLGAPDVADLVFTATRASEGLAGARLSVGGRDVTDEAAISENHLRYEPGELSDGAHTLRLEPGDEADPGPSHTWSFVVDTTPPELTVTAPDGAVAADEAIVVAGTAVDAHRVEVDGPVAELDGERFSRTTAATPPAEIGVVASDDLGNTAETTLEVAAANGAPETVPGVQMSMWAWASPVTRETREPVLDLAERGLISAVSLDIKDESGAVGHASDSTSPGAAAPSAASTTSTRRSRPSTRTTSASSGASSASPMPASPTGCGIATTATPSCRRPRARRGRAGSAASRASSTTRSATTASRSPSRPPRPASTTSSGTRSTAPTAPSKTSSSRASKAPPRTPSPGSSPRPPQRSSPPVSGTAPRSTASRRTARPRSARTSRPWLSTSTTSRRSSIPPPVLGRG